MANIWLYCENAGQVGIFFFSCPAKGGVYCFTSVRLSVRPSFQDIFRRIFLSNYWFTRYAISWEAFLEPSDSYFLFADSDCISRLICTCIYIYISVDWCTDAIRKRHLYIHISRLMQSENGILLLFYIFIGTPYRGKRFWTYKTCIRFLLPVFRLSWFLYTLNTQVLVDRTQHPPFYTLPPFFISTIWHT
jgi:hypothetical protein